MADQNEKKKQHSVYLSEEEARLIEEVASLKGMTLSAFLRMCALEAAASRAVASGR